MLLHWNQKSWTMIWTVFVSFSLFLFFFFDHHLFPYRDIDNDVLAFS